MAPAKPLPIEAIALFRVAPAAFIAERDALVRDLRAEDRDDDAAAVKVLRRPIVLVWALNQIADRAPHEVESLLDAGRELRAAQRAAVSSRGAAARLLEATAARRAKVAALVAVAAGALQELGSSTAALRDRLAVALETASVDEAAGADLGAGTFTALPAVNAGFGDISGLAALEGGGGIPRRAPSGSRGGGQEDAARSEREHAAAERTAMKDQEAVARATKEVADLRARLERAERELADAKVRASSGALARKRSDRAAR